MELTPEEIGDIGEEEVNSWCSKSTLINNPPKKDKKSWDIFIQWPDQKHYGKSFKVINDPKECLIQVKTSLDKSKKWDIPLSNYKNWIDSPLPVFIVELTIGKNREVDKAHLIEVDKYLIKKFIKRIKSVNNKKLNEVTLRLPQKNKIKLSANYPESFKKELEKIIGNYQSYITRKSNWKKETGFHSINVEMEIPLNDKKRLTELIDLDLGLLDKVDVTDFAKRYSWFGQELEDFDTSQPVHLEINGPPKEIILRFATLDDRLVIDLNMNLYIPNIFGRLLPKESQKVRFKSRFIEIIVERSSKTFKINISSIQGKKKLKELQNLVLLANFLHSLTEGEMISLMVKKGDFISLLKFSSSHLVNQLSGFTNFFFTVVQLNNVFDKLDIPNDKEIDFRYLDIEKNKIRNLNFILKDNRTLNFQFSMKRGAKLDFEKSVAIIPFLIHLGDFTFWCIISAIGESKFANEKRDTIELTQTDIYVEAKSKMNRETKLNDLKKSLEANYELVQNKYKDDFDLILQEINL
ncbi:hypothetical protein [Gracilimonas sp.]|uniref:hypothetical protein n=1 Tax=Gracilimonas sp. TaxID=1974203 RepID=UPI003BAB5C68